MQKRQGRRVYTALVSIVAVAACSSCDRPPDDQPTAAEAAPADEQSGVEPEAIEEPAITAPVTDNVVPGNSDGSYYGDFDALLGVGAVVEATVVELLGPEAVLNEFGGVSYPTRSENADDWTTVLGLPVLVVDDIEVVEQIGGSEKADVVKSRITDQVDAGRSVEVLAPVGVFLPGERYQFWISASQTDALKTYLAFDQDGRLVDGLGMRDPEAAFASLTDSTGLDRLDALAALATEMNASVLDGQQGELMDLIFGPVSS